MMTLTEALRWILKGLCLGIGFVLARGLLELTASVVKKR